MSILQIEISEEARQVLEEWAQQEGREAQSWAAEFFEEALKTRHHEQEARRQDVAQHLLKRADEPSVVATSQWWEDVLEQGLAEAKNKSVESESGK